MSCVVCNEVVQTGKKVINEFEILGRWGEPYCSDCVEKQVFQLSD